MLNAAARFMRAHDDILFVAHVSPDGDTLGSCLALYQMALQMGKLAQVVCEEPVPTTYRFLPFADSVLPIEGARQTDAVMCVDCADISRAGRCEPLVAAAKATFNIDHHGTNNNFADGNFVQQAAATGELIFQLLQTLRLTLTQDIATCLFAAISTDTGNFAYSNTTPDTFRMAAALAETGIDLSRLNRALFRTVPYSKVMLLGRAIQNIQMFCENRLGMSILTQTDMRECHAMSGDAEGIIDDIRDIDTVEVAVLLRESMDGLVRVSMRSKSIVSVRDIALSLGGGGHRFAAGCTMSLPIQEAADRVRGMLEAALASAEP